MQPRDYMSENEAQLFEFLTSGNKLVSEDYPDRKNNNLPEMVSALQQALENRGYLEKGDVDGVFKRSTELALIDMQRDMGISDDGIASEDFGNRLSYLNILEARQRGEDPQKGEDIPTIELRSAESSISHDLNSPFIKVGNQPSSEKHGDSASVSMREDCADVAEAILQSGVVGGENVTADDKRANVECLMDTVTEIKR